MNSQPIGSTTLNHDRLANIGLSRICLGTMRLTGDNGTAANARFLSKLHDLGIDSHHSSWEYDSDQHYVASLTKAMQSGRRFRHVVKVAEPSWDDMAFNPSRFRTKVQDECDRLGVDHIDVVQWLIRTKDPQNEPVCLELLARDKGIIGETFTSMINEGMIGAVVGFPYLPRIGHELLANQSNTTPLVDGLSLYLNDQEPAQSASEAIALTQRCPIVAIRPFAGGQIPPEQRMASIGRVLDNPRVVCAVVSLTDGERAQKLATMCLDNKGSGGSNHGVLSNGGN